MFIISAQSGLFVNFMTHYKFKDNFLISKSPAYHVLIKVYSIIPLQGKLIYCVESLLYKYRRKYTGNFRPMALSSKLKTKAPVPVSFLY